MSRYDYEASKRINALDAPFYALIMAAMRQADTINVAKLRAAWPAVYAEFEARYHAPGGLLLEDLPQSPAAGAGQPAVPAAGHHNNADGALDTSGVYGVDGPDRCDCDLIPGEHTEADCAGVDQ